VRPHAAARRAAWLGSLSLIVACEGDPALDRVGSSGFFSPPELDFGERPVGGDFELTTILRNTSGASMTVVGTQGSDFVKARRRNGQSVSNLELRPGSSEELTIRFTPTAAGNYDTTMVVQLLDKAIELPVTASARQFQPATPSLSPSSVSFTDIEIGRDVVQRVTVTNDGDLPGSVTAIGPAKAPFQITAIGGSPLSTTLPPLDPGESLDVELHYQPQATAFAEDAITFWMGTESAMLNANGTGNVPGVLSCNVSQIAFDDVARGASESRRVECQVNGGRYELAAIRFAPGTSNVFRVPSVPAGLDGNRSIAFDVVLEAIGLPADHFGRLEVVAAHNAIVGIPLSGHVAPPIPGSTDLSVKINWNTGMSDFDVHLVRSGRPLFERANDCYFDNKNPDWGVNDYGGDDPFLDQDDTDGYGPEEVNLSFAVADTYDIYVQYFNYMGSGPPPTSVNLWLDLRGQATQLLGADIFDCGDTWQVGRVTFPVGGGAPVFVADGRLTNAYRGYANTKCR
jgi:hypothetical protein